MVRLGSDKMSKSVGNIFVLHEALDAYGRDALIMYFCGGHYRQPVEFDDDRMEEAAARVRRIREAARRLLQARRRSGRRRCATASSTRWPTTSTLPGLWQRYSTGCASPTARTPPVGDADLREMLAVLGLDNLLESERVAVPDEARELADARERARSERDYAAADRLRDELRAIGWDVRDGPDGPELLPAQ